MEKALFEVANSFSVFPAILFPAFLIAFSPASLAALEATIFPDFSKPSAAASFATFSATSDVTSDVLFLMIFDKNVSHEQNPKDRNANTVNFIQTFFIT